MILGSAGHTQDMTASINKGRELYRLEQKQKLEEMESEVPAECSQ